MLNYFDLLLNICLQAEKAKHFLYEAKYGRFGGLGDPLHALQRDSELNADSSFDESAVKAMYDDQLTQLDNLISTQHRAQHQMREQLSAVDKRFHKVTVCPWHLCVSQSFGGAGIWRAGVKGRTHLPSRVHCWMKKE